MEKHNFIERKAVKDRLVLYDFVENETNFNDLRYIISFFDYLRKEDNRRNGNFLVFEGRFISLKHLIKCKPFFGNIKMMKCSPDEMKRDEFNRMIIVNDSHLFLKSMLFVQCLGNTYKLKLSSGPLHLNIPKRKTIKVLKSSEIINS